MIKYLLIALTISVICANGFQTNQLKRQNDDNFGIKESATHLINRLVNILKDALKQGRETFDKVVNDADVKAILDHLGPLSRKIAESIIQGFKDLLDKIDNATKDKSGALKRDLKESSANLINRLVNILKDALKQGRETFDKVVNDEDVKGILNHLGPLSRKIADSIIQGFKDLLDKIDNATKDHAIKRDVNESTERVIYRLVTLLREAYEQGEDEYDRVANGHEVAYMLNGLNAYTKKFAEELIKQFRNEDDTPLRKRVVPESTERVIYRLVTLLREAYEQGEDEYDRVANGHEVAYMLNGLDAYTKKFAEELIKQFRNDDNTPQRKRLLLESSTHLINRLVRLLKAAFEQGRETFDKVVNDEDVKAILDHLGPLTRRIADNIIQGFKDLLDRIDNATKNQSQVSKRDFKETSASLLGKLIKLLKAGFEQGREAYEKVINDEDVKAILDHLGPLSRRVAETMIEKFKELLEKIDKATNDQPQQKKRGIKESSAALINRLVNILKDSLKQGREAFDKVVNDEDVKGILEHLGPLSRKVAESIIQGFKDLLDKIDNATKDNTSVSKRDLQETSAHLINRLVKLLRQGFEGGREAYEKVINDKDVQGILDHLGPLTRKVAQSIINNFYDLLNRIDEATKQ